MNHHTGNSVQDLCCPLHPSSLLNRTGDALTCTICDNKYSYNNGFPDLIVGGRFEDEYCECMWMNEERTGRHLAKNFLSPFLSKYFRHDSKDTKILSIGCGVGSDVEQLVEDGFDAYGVDAGNRSEYWNRRKEKHRYVLANGKHLPFNNESFDVVIMGCVLPHIGVLGDTYVTTEDATTERSMAAREMLRVLRPNGHIIVSSPNKRCPIDFFHRNKVQRHVPRLHSTKRDFLLSVEDYSAFFSDDQTSRAPSVLPIGDYWGFYSSSEYLLGRILQLPVKLYFSALSTNVLAPLRNTALNPWLILHFQK